MIKKIRQKRKNWREIWYFYRKRYCTNRNNQEDNDKTSRQKLKTYKIPRLCICFPKKELIIVIIYVERQKLHFGNKTSTNKTT